MPPFRKGLLKRKVDAEDVVQNEGVNTINQTEETDQDLITGQLDAASDTTDSEHEDNTEVFSDHERDEVLFDESADSTFGDDEQADDASDSSSDVTDSEDDGESEEEDADSDSEADSGAESGPAPPSGDSASDEERSKARPAGRVKIKPDAATQHTDTSVDRLADSIHKATVNTQPVTQKDEYSSGDTSDEEDRRNTVGDVPQWWYREYPHVGYDLDGRRIIKPPQRDQIDDFLKKCEDPEFWRTVRDPSTGQDVVLSKQDLELLRRVRAGLVPSAQHDEYAPWLDWFSRDVLAAPLRAFPDHKRSFLPSRDEARAVGRLVHALRMGWAKTRRQLADERRQRRQRAFYDLWGAGSADARALQRHIPAPRRPPPGHAESYNPPPEYLLDAQEMKEWNKLSETPWKRKYTFLPTRHASLRAVPAYERFTRERFLRCLDLYLAPRAIKMRLTIGPEALVPKLPSPRELQPFPTFEAQCLRGHDGLVRSVDFDPSGQYIASAGDDGTVRGQCTFYTFHMTLRLSVLGYCLKVARVVCELVVQGVCVRSVGDGVGTRAAAGRQRGARGVRASSAGLWETGSGRVLQLGGSVARVVCELVVQGVCVRSVGDGVGTLRARAAAGRQLWETGSGRVLQLGGSVARVVCELVVQGVCVRSVGDGVGTLRARAAAGRQRGARGVRASSAGCVCAVWETGSGRCARVLQLGGSVARVVCELVVQGVCVRSVGDGVGTLRARAAAGRQRGARGVRASSAGCVCAVWETGSGRVLQLGGSVARVVCELVVQVCVCAVWETGSGRVLQLGGSVARVVCELVVQGVCVRSVGDGVGTRARAAAGRQRGARGVRASSAGCVCAQCGRRGRDACCSWAAAWRAWLWETGSGRCARVLQLGGSVARVVCELVVQGVCVRSVGDGVGTLRARAAGRQRGARGVRASSAGCVCAVWETGSGRVLQLGGSVARVVCELVVQGVCVRSVGDGVGTRAAAGRQRGARGVRASSAGLWETGSGRVLQLGGSVARVVCELVVQGVCVRSVGDGVGTRAAAGRQRGARGVRASSAGCVCAVWETGSGRVLQLGGSVARVVCELVVQGVCVRSVGDGVGMCACCSWAAAWRAWRAASYSAGCVCAQCGRRGRDACCSWAAAWRACVGDGVGTRAAAGRQRGARGVRASSAGVCVCAVWETGSAGCVRVLQLGGSVARVVCELVVQGVCVRSVGDGVGTRAAAGRQRGARGVRATVQVCVRAVWETGSGRVLQLGGSVARVVCELVVQVWETGSGRALQLGGSVARVVCELVVQGVCVRSVGDGVGTRAAAGRQRGARGVRASSAGCVCAQCGRRGRARVLQLGGSVARVVCELVVQVCVCAVWETGSGRVLQLGGSVARVVCELVVQGVCVRSVGDGVGTRAAAGRQRGARGVRASSAGCVCAQCGGSGRVLQLGGSVARVVCELVVQGVCVRSVGDGVGTRAAAGRQRGARGVRASSAGCVCAQCGRRGRGRVLQLGGSVARVVCELAVVQGARVCAAWETGSGRVLQLGGSVARVVCELTAGRAARAVWETGSGRVLQLGGSVARVVCELVVQGV
ncbi:hypothetical protein HW555_006185, partial [Spodoptera exigua]